MGGPARLIPRLAFKETTGLPDTFFRVIYTSGPPGANGGMGPNTDTTSIGCVPVGLAVPVQAAGNAAAMPRPAIIKIRVFIFMGITI